MRESLLLLGLLLFINTGLVFSQTNQVKKNTFRIESGSAFTGSGDLTGYCFYNEYSRWVGERITISSAFGFLNFSNNDNTDILLYQNANCKSVEIAGYFYPIKRKVFSFEVGIGGYFRNWKWIYATGTNQYFFKEGISLGPQSYASQVVNGIGYSFSIGTTLNLNETIGFNLRGVFQNDSNGDNAITARLGLNIKF
jgi:hypothetical protein